MDLTVESVTPLDLTQDDFQIDTADPRFSAVFESSDFHIDPTNTQYRETPATKALQEERHRRMRQREEQQQPPLSGGNKRRAEIDALVSSVKRKAKKKNNKRRKKN